jgi:hypothetical protein
MQSSLTVKFKPAAILVMLAFGGAANAEELARITRVVLYPGSATVERTAQVTPGMTRLEISGLPANFDARTLRAESDAGIRIGEVSVIEQARTRTTNAREAEL